MPDGPRHLGTLSCGSSFKSWNYFIAVFLHSFFNSLYKSFPETQTSYINKFILVTYSSRNPSESNSDNVFLKEFHFGYWKCASIGTLRYVNWSSLAIQSNPSVFTHDIYYFHKSTSFADTSPILSPKLLLNLTTIF